MTSIMKPTTKEARAREVLQNQRGEFGLFMSPDQMDCAVAAILEFAADTPPGEIEYEVWQKDAFGDGDAMVAGSTSIAEARHYVAVYEQYGPTWIVEVTRRPLSAAPAPDAKEGDRA